MIDVSLKSVSIVLGNRSVISQADIDIEHGMFVGVLGPNGSGKTTLMRAILGLVQPAGGTIEVLGTPTTQTARGNRHIGYMPQMRSTIGSMHLRGWDFVASALDGHRWGLPLLGAKGRSEVARTLELVGAAELARRSLSDMSGGERQRLLLAQALLGRPRLLLLDEPLISLDPHHQRTVVELVKQVQAELDITVLFSAHELNPLLNAIDRVLYLCRGQVALGTVDEVITGPVLSRLYGSAIEVLHMKNRIFVMSGDYEIDKDEHRHEDHHHHA